jgi:hypothetical protein
MRCRLASFGFGVVVARTDVNGLPLLHSGEVLMETHNPRDSWNPKVSDLQEAIRRRAEEIYFESGEIPGRDLENWKQAERDIRFQFERMKTRRAIVVKVEGIEYVGEYQAESPEDYSPGEFSRGESVPVLIEGDRMLVRRPNGRTLETRIVHRLG